MKWLLLLRSATTLARLREDLGELSRRLTGGATGRGELLGIWIDLEMVADPPVAFQDDKITRHNQMN